MKLFELFAIEMVDIVPEELVKEMIPVVELMLLRLNKESLIDICSELCILTNVVPVRPETSNFDMKIFDEL